jgi:hypothetical protein
MKGVPLHQIERERYHPRCGSVVNCEVIGATQDHVFDDERSPLRALKPLRSDLLVRKPRLRGKQLRARRPGSVALACGAVIVHLLAHFLHLIPHEFASQLVTAARAAAVSYYMCVVVIDEIPL